MRIIEWNCQGAFRLKYKEIYDLQPDILIVLECEEELKLQFGKLVPSPKDFLWIGEKGKKGVGIFSYSNFKIKLLKEYNPKFKYVVPVEVSDDVNSFILFAIWAKDNKDNPLSRYIGQVWNAVNYYKTLFRNNTILIGDFNSNQIWDDKARVGNHTDVVNFLNSFNIESLYHKQENESQGKESAMTFFMHRNSKKPYHIDYVFSSFELIKNGFKLKLGNIEDWLDKSDHIPMILDIIGFSSKIEVEFSYADFVIRNFNALDVDTKYKYSMELREMSILAEKLDIKIDRTGESFDLIDKVEIINEIDRLTKKLNA